MLENRTKDSKAKEKIRPVLQAILPPQPQPPPATATATAATTTTSTSATAVSKVNVNSTFICEPPADMIDIANCVSTVSLVPTVDEILAVAEAAFFETIDQEIDGRRRVGGGAGGSGGEEKS